MTRRSGKGLGLTVRVSHEATRLSQVHVASAFERLVPVLERQTRQPCTESSKCVADAAHGRATPMTDPIANRYVTNAAMPRTGVRSR